MLATRRAQLVEVVEEVHQLPYGRPSERSVDGMLRERRGTCSTKHAHLHDALARGFPEVRPRLVHRVYVVMPDVAAGLFGETARAVVPAEGLTDVHRFLRLELAGRDVVVDATFPGPPFDGESSMTLACGPGVDFPCGSDPAGEKAALESAYCHPSVREPFIAALSVLPDPHEGP